MRTYFKGGPYDGVVLQLQEGLNWVLLPVDVTVAITVEGAQTYRCQAEYIMLVQDDLKTTFIFQGLSAP